MKTTKEYQKILEDVSDEEIYQYQKILKDVSDEKIIKYHDLLGIGEMDAECVYGLTFCVAFRREYDIRKSQDRISLLREKTKRIDKLLEELLNEN